MFLLWKNGQKMTFVIQKRKVKKKNEK